jgi:hypothetical protein
MDTIHFIVAVLMIRRGLMDEDGTIQSSSKNKISQYRLVNKYMPQPV